MTPNSIQWNSPLTTSEMSESLATVPRTHESTIHAYWSSSLSSEMVSLMIPMDSMDVVDMGSSLTMTISWT